MIMPGTRGGNGAWANKNAADMRAKELASIFQALRAAGCLSHRAIAYQLNQCQIPTVRGGKWHRTSVARVLERLKRQGI
jgi:hypothetical protein